MPSFSRRRALGQHFLRDRGVIDRIVQTAVTAARETSSRLVVEIGPGRGALTEPLLLALPHGFALTLFERDRALAARWRARLAGRHGARVREGDFLEAPPGDWLEPAPVTVVSNLPYSAGTAILLRLAGHPGQIAAMVLMFQAEVARRLRDEPGGGDWGSLSLWIQNRWEVSRLVQVPRRAFAPPPKVDSEVVSLRPRPRPLIEGSDSPAGATLWEHLLKTAFAHRRKMLRSGLPSTGPWRDALARAGIDPTLRAEALDWEAWRRFFHALRDGTRDMTKSE